MSAADASSALDMVAVCSFVERWRPGATKAFVPATPEQITALAGPSGGVSVLPPVYLDFLSTMGVSTGGLGLLWGSTSVLELLAERERDHGSQPDPRRYLKWGIGENNRDCGKEEDWFFDLRQRTSDLSDAMIVEAYPRDLADAASMAIHPVSTFSDRLRTMLTQFVWFDDSRGSILLRYTEPTAPTRAAEVLNRLDFDATELGVSGHCIPLVSPSRQARACLDVPRTATGATVLEIAASDPRELALLREILLDHLGEG